MRHHFRISLFICCAPVTNSFYISFHVRPIKNIHVKLLKS